MLLKGLDTKRGYRFIIPSLGLALTFPLTLADDLDQGMPTELIPLTLSHFPPLLATLLTSPLDGIQYSHIADEYVFVGQSILMFPREGFHWRKLLMSLSLLLQHCPACLVHLWWFLRWEVNGLTAAL